MQIVGLLVVFGAAAFAKAAFAQDLAHGGTTAVPVFGEVVRFQTPQGFKTASETKEAEYYAFSLVPKAENAKTWSEMVSVTGTKGLAKHVTAPAFASVTQTTTKARCPTSYAFLDLGALTIDGYPASASVHGCGSSKSDTGNEKDVSLIIAIQGKEDLLTVQWSIRGPAEKAPPQLDPAVWTSRLKALGPIKICRRVPGEKPPFVSCGASARQ